MLDWVSSKWVPFRLRVCFGATVLIAVSYDWAPPLPGETALGTNVILQSALKQILVKNYV